ncbi:MAG: CvpA family protein [Bacteroidales bacterium]|jgi:membrane protein required for colicin V production|nr:CvpA family protein [Bacteroidales bacterium]MBR0322210.1 CvpA family protein [Bacteroidales bacterium]
MSILDIILLICFIPALVQGVRKGFIAQAISIASIIIGIWASSRFAEVVSEWLGKYITVSDQVMKVVAFALIFIAVFLVLAAVGKLLEGMFKMVTLGWLNRLAGLVFALLKTSLILGILIMVFTSLNDTFDLVSEATLNESVLYPPFKEAAFKIFPYIKDMLTLN